MLSRHYNLHNATTATKEAGLISFKKFLDTYFSGSNKIIHDRTTSNDFAFYVYQPNVIKAINDYIVNNKVSARTIYLHYHVALLIGKSSMLEDVPQPNRAFMKKVESKHNLDEDESEDGRKTCLWNLQGVPLFRKAIDRLFVDHQYPDKNKRAKIINIVKEITNNIVESLRVSVNFTI